MTGSEAPAARRVGILGGSFDPVHNAHVALADCACEQLQLDELRWLPAGQPWQKASLTPAHHRVAMVLAAIAGKPIQLLDRSEVDRDGPTYTVDTVQAMHRPGLDLYWVTGQDQFGHLSSWHRWEDLLPLLTWAVAARAGQTVAAQEEVAARGPRVVALRLPEMAVAATDLRERARRGEPLTGLVPPAVARYIERQGLYRDAGSDNGAI